jgi:hypothetical protein
MCECVQNDEGTITLCEACSAEWFSREQRLDLEWEVLRKACEWRKHLLVQTGVADSWTEETKALVKSIDKFNANVSRLFGRRRDGP